MVSGGDDLPTLKIIKQPKTLVFGSLKNDSESCHSELSEESRSANKEPARFLFAFGMIDHATPSAAGQLPGGIGGRSKINQSMSKEELRHVDYRMRFSRSLSKNFEAGCGDRRWVAHLEPPNGEVSAFYPDLAEQALPPAVLVFDIS